MEFKQAKKVQKKDSESHIGSLVTQFAEIDSVSWMCNMIIDSLNTSLYTELITLMSILSS